MNLLCYFFGILTGMSVINALYARNAWATMIGVIFALLPIGLFVLTCFRNYKTGEPR